MLINCRGPLIIERAFNQNATHLRFQGTRSRMWMFDEVEPTMNHVTHVLKETANIFAFYKPSIRIPGRRR